MQKSFMVRVNQILFTSIHLLLACSLLALPACQDDNAQSTAKTIRDVVVKGNAFTLLEAAGLRAGLAEALRTGMRTVFAPTDDAFRVAGLASGQEVRNADVQTLTRILTYQVVPAWTFFTNLSAGNVTTVQGGTLAVTLSQGVNGRGNGNGSTTLRVLQANLPAGNGMVHVIDWVLLP